MATFLDYRDFRNQYDYLTALHDEWMHNSTGTSNTPQGTYDGYSGPFLTFHNIEPPLAISGVGFSPADMRTFLSNPDITGTSSSGSSQGGNNNNKGGGRRTTIIKKGGGGKVLGPNALGGFPKLGNVPYTTQPASGGLSPGILILMLGGGGLVIYFIWHKLRKSKAEDKELDKKGE